MDIIKIKDLSIGYNNQALVNNINFNVKENSCTCIYGDNGCGKTTLLKTLSTLIHPISGEVTINGFDLKDKWNIRKISAFVFQKNNIDEGFPILTKEVVAMGRYRINPYKTTNKDKEVIEEVMRKTNTLDLKDMPYGHLSGGQKQRVQIALSLASEPKILFLDEPGTYLDTKSRDLLIETINEIKKNTTLIVVSHYKHFTDSIADNVYNLEAF